MPAPTNRGGSLQEIFRQRSKRQGRDVSREVERKSVVDNAEKGAKRDSKSKERTIK